MEDKEKEKDLSEEYEKLMKKYDFLPKFKKLSEDFDIEKIYEKETDFILREIRRTLSEKISAYMHFFETLINPASPPLFIFSVLKGIPKSTKEKTDIIYKKLAKFQIESMKLDTIYDEEKEAKQISHVYEEWQNLKQDIYRIIDSFEAKIDDKNESIRGNYFG